MLGQPWSPSVSEAVEEWRAAVVDGRREGRKLAHYKEVRYETLVADPEPLFADLFAWLELDLTPAVMEAALREAARPFTVSTDNKKIGSGKWRDDADPAALAELERAAGDVMRELGYVDAGEARAPANIVAAAPVVAAAAVPAGAPATRSPGNPLRTGMARVRALVRPAPANVDALVRRRLQGANRVVHGFLAGMGSRSAEEMLADFEPDAEVRLFGDTVYEGAGEEARRRLLDAVAADPVIGWRQVRSDVVVGIPTTTTITSYEGPDGQAAHRVVAVRVNEQKRITRVTYHCLDG
jgi:hypothetical protein